jgi:integrase
MSVDRGIRPRHARSCPQQSDKQARCRCEPTFEASVWDAEAGKRITRAFPTKTAARQWREEARVSLRAGKLTADRGPTLREAVDAWLDGLRSGAITNRSGDRYKPAAIRQYGHNLELRVLPELGDVRLGEVTPRDLQGLIDAMVEAKRAPATIDSAMTPLKALYRRAVARGDVRTNPTLGLEKPAVRAPERLIVTPQQAGQMIAALDGADRALWAVAFYTGLRRGELIGLRWEDVDLATGVVHVRRGWDAVEGPIAPKSRQGKRKVPIAALLRDHLDQHLLAREGDEVFESHRWVTRAAERAHEAWTPLGLPLVKLHDARHTFASYMIAAGVNVKALSTYMGHATIAITLDLYGHLLPGNEDEAAGLIDAFLAAQNDATVAQTVAHHAGLALQSA